MKKCCLVSEPLAPRKSQKMTDSKNKYVLLSGNEMQKTASDSKSQDRIQSYELEKKDNIGIKNKDQKNAVDEETPLSTVNQKCMSIYKQIEGKLLIFLAGAISVNVYSLNKHVGHLPVGQFSSFIFIFSFLFLLPALLFKEMKITFHGKAKYVIARAFFGAVGGPIRYWAAKEMEYGDSVALGSLTPVFAAMFSRLLWKEKVNILTIAALFIGLAGVIIVAKPSFLFGASTGIRNSFIPLVPLAGSIIYGFAFSCMRKVGTKISPILVSLLVSAFVVPDGIIFQLIYGDKFVFPDCYTDRIVLCVGGFGLFVTLLLLNRGLALEKSGPGVLIRNCDIVIAYIIQVAFFDCVPDVLSVVGALLVISSAVIVTVNKLFPDNCCNYEI